MKNRLVLMFALAALTCMVALGADVTGKWMSEATGKGGPQTLNLTQSGGTLTGKLEGGRGGAVDITNGKVDGDNVSFDVVRTMGGNEMTIKYTGTVSGSTLKLSFEMGGRGPRELTFTKQ